MESVRNGKCQKWKVSEMESVRNGKYQKKKDFKQIRKPGRNVLGQGSTGIGKFWDGKSSEVKSLRTRVCWNRIVSEKESVRS